jgi:hypothetical protein
VPLPPDHHGGVDLGDGYHLWFTSWAPDRELNPQFADRPDIDRAGFIYRHRAAGPIRLGQTVLHDDWCEGGGMLDVPGVRDLVPDRAMWQVESWEPLTLAPSLLCRACGSHGFIREGRWLPA